MELINTLITSSAPNYLSHLHIPRTIGGFTKLSVRDWVSLVPLVGSVTLFGWLSYYTFNSIKTKGQINPNVQKDCPKVVHGFDIEDLGDKVAFCRCWRSSKFPYCDGTHSTHNQITGDNIGPLCLKKR